MHEGQTPLPSAFLRAMRAQLGEDEFAAYLQAVEQPHARALRVNLLRQPDGAPPLAQDVLDGPVPWSPGAYFVAAGARPGLDPLHEAGAYYLQEPSALTAAQVLMPRPGERVLDLCAAPGGKSTQLAALMGGQGLLVANEIVPARAQILSRNIERMGVAHAVVTCASPDALSACLPAFFDRVLVDAPCSGEGMFRRQPEARAEWTEQSPALCAQRQRDILCEAAKMLAPGGTLVYSTCTFNQTENEGVIEEFVRTHADFGLVPFALAGLGKAEAGYMHLYPQRMRGEGHFVACLRRQGEGARGMAVPLPQDKEAMLAAKALCEQVLAPGMALERVRRVGDTLFALPEGMPALPGVRIVRAGLCIGRIKGRRVEPEHALAMALSPAKAARTVPLTREQALAYQGGQTLPAPEGLAKGYALALLDGCPLGFVKCADGQLKNHYPKGLRRVPQG